MTYQPESGMIAAVHHVIGKGSPLTEVQADTQPRLRLLGEIALFRHGAFVALPPSKKTRALLAYLAATARPHRRDRLCALFWDIPDDPRGSLRWSLSRLRPLLDDADCQRIHADRESVSLAIQSVTIDLAIVERELARENAPIADLAAAAGLFEGEFAEGLDLHGCADFQVWLTTQREAVRRLHLRLLDRLVDHLPAGEALPFAQRRLSIDPDNADHHAQVLTLLVAAGRRQEAEQQAGLSIARVRETDQAASDALALHWRKLQQPAQSNASRSSRPIILSGEMPVDAEPDWPDERKQVTVLHANLRDESLVDDPEIAAGRLDPLVTSMIAAVERYDGTVTQRRPEGITALFGAPAASENHPTRACLAALAIQEACAGATIGIAVHAGEVVARSQKGRVEAFGPALKIAEEIERVTPVGTIYLARQTFRLVEGMFLGDPCDALNLPGFNEPIELLSLTGQAAMAGGWFTRVIRGLTAFAGRQHELASLLRVADNVRAGKGQVAVVVGEPGLGKSRLLHELVQHDGFHPAAWRQLEGAATPYDVDTPYFLIGRVLRFWLQITGPLPEAALRARLHTALTMLDPALTWAEAALGVPLDLPAHADWNTLDPSVRRRQVIDAVDAVINALAAQKPVVLLIEDLHWADPESAAIIDTLVNRLARRPVLLCVTTRPEGAPPWMAKSVCQPLRLTSLDDAAAEEMAGALLGDDTSLAELKRRLVERTAGTPLFLEEAVNTLVESGSLIGERGAHRLAHAQSDLSLPATVQAVLGERIDRLLKPLKLLLQVAAVIGEDVPVSILLPLMELPADELAAQLEALQEAEFLFETEPAPQRHFAFKHALIRDVAYASLLVAQRRKLHRRLLKIILPKERSRREPMIERLAHHAAHAERWGLAAKFLRQAGDKSVHRSAYHEAVRSFEGALQMLSHLKETPTAELFSAVVRLRLRPSLGAITAFTQASQHLDIAERNAESRGDIQRMLAIAIHKSYILSSQGKIEAALEAAERACALSQNISDPLWEIEPYLALGQACAFRGDIAGALKAIRPHRTRLTTEFRHETMGQTGLRSVWCLMHLADALTLKGDLAEARELTQEAMIIAEEVNKPFDRAVVHLREGFIELQDAQSQKAVTAFDHAHALAEGSDLGWVAAWARTGLGYAYVLSGHVDAGFHLLEATKRQATEAEFLAVEGMSTVFLADARRRCGQWRAAASEADMALAIARRWGYWDIEVMALLCLGQAIQHLDDSGAAAMTHLREAATLAQSRGYRLMLAEAHQAMVPILEKNGDAKNAAVSARLADTL